MPKKSKKPTESKQCSICNIVYEETIKAPVCKSCKKEQQSKKEIKNTTRIGGVLTTENFDTFNKFKVQEGINTSTALNMLIEALDLDDIEE